MEHHRKNETATGLPLSRPGIDVPAQLEEIDALPAPHLHARGTTLRTFVLENGVNNERPADPELGTAMKSLERALKLKDKPG